MGAAMVAQDGPHADGYGDCKNYETEDDNHESSE
jgi:hypothetical protein